MDLINLLKEQAEMYRAKLERGIITTKTKNEVYKAHSSALREFYSHAFRPTVDKNEIREFNRNIMQETMDHISSDINLTYGELGGVSSILQDAYNTNKDHRTSIKNKISYLASIISDLNIMTRGSADDSITFKDSLANYDFIDKDFSVGIQSDIATSEGIAFLHISNDLIANEDGTEVRVNGNGTNGNYHVVKRINIQTANEDYNIYIKHNSDDDPHDQPEAIIDNQSQTWFEYQKVGFKEALRRYDTDWAVASETHDDLTLRVNIKLKKKQEINWIDIESYVPERSRSSTKVYSIRVSQDGSEFIPIYKDRDIINSEVNLVPRRYLNNEVFGSDTIAKFASSGVFNFPKVVAQHIEIIFKQDKPYDESIGHIYYKEITTSGTGESFERMVPAQTVPSSIINAPIGKYQIETNKIIVKGIEVFDGWRYCIGLKGIDIFNRKFEKQSELITKKFESSKPISKIMLYANEIIPNEYMTYGLEKRNDWIKYYITIDDTTWYQISPMHHNQVGTLAIPPKIYEINSLSAPDVRLNAINKGYLTPEKDIYNVRLKIVFTRPDELSGSTPILEEYGLECVFGGTK